MKRANGVHCNRRTVVVAGLVGSLLLGQLAPREAMGADLWRWTHRHPKTPHEAECPPNMITLAKKVTKLEDQVRRNGSITIKQPDVWGESNLMSYIQEYEEQMKESVDKFRETIQGYTITSDTGQLASSTTVGAGVDATVFTSTQGTSANAANQTNANSTTVPLSQLTKLVSSLNPTSVGADGKTATTPFGLEPNELERQHSVYIQMNQALRRTNMGDDNSRAAGNSLYLLRFPVSVLPGRETYEGYSAVITLRAHLVIDDAHLRYTFPKLAVADAVESMIPILMRFWDQKEVSADLAPTPAASGLRGFAAPPGVSQRGNVNSMGPGSIRQMINQYGPAELNALLHFVQDQYKGLTEPPKVEELRTFLIGQFTNLYEQLILSDLFTPGDDHPQALDCLESAAAALSYGDCTALFQCRCAWTQVVSTLDMNCDPHSRDFSWILGFNAAALDANLMRLIEARDRAARRSELSIPVDPAFHFYVVDGPWQKQINDTWAELIEAEFPVHVFALNPMIEEQNVYDAFSRSRDLQIAFAMALANGNIRAGQAMRFSRQVSLEMAAIGLNRTAVAFAHGNDTFGWYFHPRVQSPPPERSNIAAFGRLLWSSGPTERYDQRHQSLEPGIRECEAVIVMPGFVPGVRFDVITNWEKRSKPGAVKRDYAEMLVEGAEILNTLEYAANVGDQSCFRPADYQVLVSRVEQIEKMLPLQSVDVRLPFEHEIPGSEIFDGGKSQLKPRLDGYYGLNYVAEKAMGEVFLTGAHFHPVVTRVILGGREATEVKVLSRELLKVKFNYVAKSLTEDPVEVRIATPAGISPPALIPMTPGAASQKTEFAWSEAMPLRGAFTVVDCGMQIDCLPPRDLTIKQEGASSAGPLASAVVSIAPKLLSADGTVLIAAVPDMRIPIQASSDGRTFTVSYASLLAEITNYLNSTGGGFAVGLSTFTLSADTYLEFVGGKKVKVNKPLVVELAAKPCPCPAPAAAPCLTPQEKTMLEEVEPMMVPPQEYPEHLPPQARKKRSTLRLVAGESASTTTLRPRVRHAHQPDTSRVRQAGATLRR